MSEFKHVGRVMVSLWGQRVGIIVPVDSRGETYAFQYDRKFLKSGLEIAPLMMPLRREPYAFADRFALGTAPRVIREVKAALGLKE